MRPETFYRRVSVETGQVDLDHSRRATAAVLHTLRDRLTADEARQAAAQLPAELRGLWTAGEASARRPLKMHRQAFLDRVRTEGELGSTAEAHAVTAAVFAALKDQLSPGEADDILTQLPRDLKQLWITA